MKTISSESFYSSWINIVNQEKKELLNVWRNPKEFTKKIITDDDSIICQIAQKYNLKCYNRDYYAIDSVLYKQEDLVPKVNPNTFWLRDIRVAFEHENVFKSGLYQEVSHLLITNSELKVLVSYPEHEPDDELAYLHEVISNTRHANDLSENENFLIIFGYENGFVWEGYVYNEYSWRIIKST